MSLESGKESAVVSRTAFVGTSGSRDHLASGTFIVCAQVLRISSRARLAENPDVSVLLLETGGSDEVPSVTEAPRG